MTSCNPGLSSNTTPFNLFSQLPCVRHPPHSGMLSASRCLHFIPRTHTSQSMILFNVCLSLSLSSLYCLFKNMGSKNVEVLFFSLLYSKSILGIQKALNKIIVIYRININAKCSLIILRLVKMNKHFGY